MIIRCDIGLLGDAMGAFPIIIHFASQSLDDVYLCTPDYIAEIYDMIPKKYNIKHIHHMPSELSGQEIKTLNLNFAFASSGGNPELHMTQAHFKTFNLPVPPHPIRPEIELEDLDVPIFDYVLAPFSRSLPIHQKWPQEKWTQLVRDMPDKEFVLFGNNKFDDPGFLGEHPNLTVMFSEPIKIAMNVMKKSRLGLISVVTGPSHFAYALNVPNFLFINQGAWGKNPDAICFEKNHIHNYSVEEVIIELRKHDSS